MRLNPDRNDGSAHVAFFFMQQNQLSANGFYVDGIENFRKKLKTFNFGLTSCTYDKVANYPPKILVVADEIFNLPDHELNKLARTVTPNYFRGGSNQVKPRGGDSRARGGAL